MDLIELIQLVSEEKERKRKGDDDVGVKEEDLPMELPETSDELLFKEWTENTPSHSIEWIYSNVCSSREQVQKNR